MKNPIARIWLSALLLGLLLVSCERFFDPKIENQLSEAEAYSDYLSTRAAVDGLYTQLQDLMTSYVVTGELRGDMLRPNDWANTDLQAIFSLNYNSGNAYFAGRTAYTAIANCNDVIWHLENLMERGTTYDEKLYSMHAEAVLLRTWVNFYLMRTFGQVPYITASYTAEGNTTSIEDWLAGHSGDPVETGQLISEVESVIPFLIPSEISESQYFNLASAWAMLGELYLWDDDYSQAIDALLASVNTGGGSRFILDKDLENNKWQNIFKGDESATDEIMTKIIFSKAEKQENELMPLFSAIAQGGMQLSPVEQFVIEIEGSYRFDGTYKNGGEVGKYTRSLDAPYTSDMPVILYRAADVHLMLAEAYTRIGQIELALQLVNNGSDTLFTAASKGVRGRIGLPPVTLEGNSLADSMLNMEDLILGERSLEMAYEGKRWFDILRIGKRRNDPDYIGNMMLKRYESPDSARIKAFFSDPGNWYLPLE